MAIKGLDISTYQKGINFDSIKNSGWNFLILRAGFTGWGTGVNYNKDDCFEDFYRQAKARGINVGAYWYSCANTKQKGIDEANFMYNNCLKGKQFEYPIYIDVEDEHWQIKTKSGTTDAIIGFCETLENLGYYVGIYANSNWFKNYIETSRLNDYDKWLAQWSSSQPNFMSYGVWQYSSTGAVGNKTVDTNYSYKDYPIIIKNGGFNGFSKGTVTPSPEETKPLKSVDEIARIIINEKDYGGYGTGDYRFNKLRSEGYNAQEVQDRINEILGINVSHVTYYTVVAGDNLTKIAKKFNTTIQKIANDNNIKNVDLIYVGQILVIK